jgi:16S rRNA (cytosine1402-N4)-methyltransferase
MNPDREFQHLPVLLREAIQPLVENRGNIYVDCTLGGGGHTAALLKARPGAIVYAIDRDGAMLAKAEERFAAEITAGRLHLIAGNYGEIRALLAARGLNAVDGIMVDAGVSSFQLDQPERGFSFLRNGPLDMRMDQSQPLTAYELVNRWSREELEKIFYEYGEERFSRKIVNRIIEHRDRAPIEDTATLAGIVENCLPRVHGAQRSAHPATRVFQAIRIAVNGELEGLKKLLLEIPELLKTGGVFSAISFHSLEDRLVKERLRFLSSSCVCPPEIPTCARCGQPPGFLSQKKPILPSDEEMQNNPRSRSAKLRVFLRGTNEFRRPAFLGGQQ